MALANVALTDTFDTWRLRTNQLVFSHAYMTEGFYYTNGTITIANSNVATSLNVTSGNIRVKGNTFDSNAVTFVSNSSALIISGNGGLGSTVYFQTGDLSTTVADANIANIASAYTVNAVNQLAVQIFDRANTGGANVNATAPDNPITGQLWWNSELGRMFIYYTDPNSSQWVEAIPPAQSTIEIENDGTTNNTLYPIFTPNTSGQVAAAKVTSTKLTFNPSTGLLSATQFNSLSDAALKSNIQPIVSPLEKVKQMHGVGFTWNDSKQRSYGIIAQELEKIVPDLVSDINNNKAVNYDGLIAFLIEAIKELSDKLENKE